VVDEGESIRPVVVVVAVKHPPLPVRGTICRVVDSVERNSAVFESKLFNELDPIQSLQYGAIMVAQ
jgi:hypothetical protein